MQKMIWLPFKYNTLPFFSHHINMRKKYYFDNVKAEIIMPDFMILISTYKNTAHLQIESFPKFRIRA